MKLTIYETLKDSFKMSGLVFQQISDNQININFLPFLVQK